MVCILGPNFYFIWLFFADAPIINGGYIHYSSQEILSMMSEVANDINDLWSRGSHRSHGSDRNLKTRKPMVAPPGKAAWRIEAFFCGPILSRGTMWSLRIWVPHWMPNGFFYGSLRPGSHVKMVPSTFFCVIFSWCVRTNIVVLYLLGLLGLFLSS